MANDDPDRADMNENQSKIRLRKPAQEDAEAIVEAVQTSLAELSVWMPWARSDYDVESAKQWIDGAFGDLHSFLMIEADGSIVGTCGINAHDALNQRANLGYWVRSDRTGRGYATHAARTVAKFGVENGLQRLEIVVSTQNRASCLVAERIGAHYEGVARARLMLHGVAHDAHIYSFTSADFT